MFWRVAAAGSIVRYEPRALVWHRHRRTMAGLTRQLMGYSGAVHSYFHRAEAATVPHRPEVRGATRNHGRWLFREAYEALWRRDQFPFEFRLSEAIGYRSGPALYAKAVAKALEDERTHGVIAPGCEVKNLTVDDYKPPSRLRDRLESGLSVVRSSMNRREEDSSPPEWKTTSLYWDLDQEPPDLDDLTQVDAVYATVARGSDVICSLWVMNRRSSVSMRRLAQLFISDKGVELLSSAPKPGTRAVQFHPGYRLSLIHI